MAALDVEKERGSSPDKSSHNDPEKAVDINAGESLKRHMSSRHLQFLAIGGTIGTGLFLGTGGDLAQAGPVSCLIAYIFMGTVVYSVMTSLGEMATYIPVTGSFTCYASRFVDPTLGFAMGWLYWFSWAITYALELAASAIVIQYWTNSISPGVFIAVFWLIFTTFNFLPVKIFAESEMYFVSLKVITIVGFVIFGICINAGAGQEGYIGFKYWSNPGAFAEYSDKYSGDLGRFLSFISVLIGASFSFQGSELVGVGAGEVGNPRRNVPRAIHGTFWGIFSLFVATVFFIGILVPSDDESLTSGAGDASASPLVIAAKRAGVKVLPDIINAVLLTAILSAANSNVYSGSRILVALANEGQAPAWVKRTNRQGVPYIAVAITSLCGLLGFLNMSAVGSNIFNWLLNIIGVAGLICWSCISLCHIRFMKALQAQGIDRSTLPYRAHLQPYLAWYGVICTLVISLVQGFAAFLPWSTADFFAAYISVILFLVLYIGHKVICRTRVVPLAEMDLIKGRLEEY